MVGHFALRLCARVAYLLLNVRRFSARNGRMISTPIKAVEERVLPFAPVLATATGADVNS
jgi:hypothetical protein